MTEHDDAGVEGLGDLFAERMPPDALEESIVDTLQAIGALSASPAQTPSTSPLWAPPGIGRIAAGLALVALGWAAGRHSAPPIPTVEAGPSFMMLLWEDANFVTNQPVEQIAAEYAAWATDVSASGATTTGNELGPTRSYAGAPWEMEGEVTEAATAAGGSSDLEAPLLGGYFVVSSTDAGTVQALAEAHPHVRNGGWIEIAPIVVR